MKCLYKLRAYIILSALPQKILHFPSSAFWALKRWILFLLALFIYNTFCNDQRQTWKMVIDVLHLFHFWFQITRIALLTEEGLLESFNDSPFQVALQSWRKLCNTEKQMFSPLNYSSHKDHLISSTITEKSGYTAKRNINV